MAQRSTSIKPPLRVMDIATRKGVSERTVRNWITVGINGKKLKAEHAGPGGVWLVAEEDLDSFMTPNTEHGPKQESDR